MSERFPEIDWYCDRCNACLNDQPGFDDHHYVWKCTECGHKNSISSDDIYCCLPRKTQKVGNHGISRN